MEAAAERVSKAVAQIPYVLGYQPEDRVVCVLPGSARSASAALPAPEMVNAWTRDLVDVLKADESPMMFVFAYGEKDLCLEVLREIRFQARNSVPVAVGVWVSGDEWVDEDTSTRGVVTESMRWAARAEAAFKGQTQPPTRAELVAQFEPSPESWLDVELLLSAANRASALSRREFEDEVNWVTNRVTRFTLERVNLSDHDAARMLVVLGHSRVQDAVMLGLDREHALVVGEMFSDLGRRAPTVVRDPPMTMLALSVWLHDGDTLLTRLALDQVQEPSEMTRLLAAACARGVRPEAWDSVKKSHLSSLQAGAAGVAPRREQPVEERDVPQQRPDPPGSMDR